MRDLEIRGAGNLLGEEQHGHMDAVGYDLYCKMLSQAVRHLKGEIPEETYATTVDLNIDAYIPASYIPNEYQKLDIYKRIAGIENEEEMDDMLEELIDRFGEPPKAVLNLLAIARLKALAHQGYITEIKQMQREIRITLYENAHLNPEGIPPLVAKYRRQLQFKPDKEPKFLFAPVGDIVQALTVFAKELMELVEEEGKSEK